MNNPTGIYHYGETLCNDPDKDFEILDYVSIGDNSESLEQPTPSLLSKYSTSSTESDINLYDSSYDIQFDTSAIGLAKAYANSSSTTMQERDNEIDINWLAQDLDVTSNRESSWDTTICHENELTLEFNSGGIKQLNGTCIIVDDLNGTLQRCPHPVEKPLKQLGGIWELDFDTVDEIVMKSKGDGLNTLGVCKSHFNYDNKQLHECQKTEVSIDRAVIRRKRCLFCGHYKYVFSRGYCTEHSWKLCNRNIQIVCNGLKVCHVFQENEFTKQSSSSRRARYICMLCFTSEEGHLYERKGRGSVLPFDCTDRHHDDSAKSLQLITKWINEISESADRDIQCLLLHEIFKGAMVFFEKLKCIKRSKNDDISDEEFDSKTTKKSKDPKDTNSHHDKSTEEKVAIPTSLSFLGVKIAFRLKKVDVRKLLNSEIYCNAIKRNLKQMGEALATLLWRSRSEVRANKEKLVMPNSLEEYQNGFPLVISNFFYGLIDTIQKNKWKVVLRKQRERKTFEKDYDETRAKKISIFFISVLLSITFPGLDIWFTHILSSLCQKPRLHTSLYSILCVANVVAHTNRYEKHLEKQRREQVDINSKLWKGNNIWNICMVDNIDLQESTFRYDNIFDVPRKTAHATLRMVAQYQLPQNISSLIESYNSELSVFQVGQSTFINNETKKLQNIFNLFVENKWLDYDAFDIRSELRKNVPIGCNIPKPNIVILKPGDNPCNNLNVHEAIIMYFDDVGIGENNFLDISADQAIFRRLVPLREKRPEIRLLLGGWHTNKCMLSTLLAIFSGYGIYRLAASLGVSFLEKLEKVVDYTATCRVIELIWVAVGSAITAYVKHHGKSIESIESENYGILRVWYQFFVWAGYWVCHKIGIRHGNHYMQYYSLAAFAPLFAVAGRCNYSESVVYYLAQISSDPTLQVLLEYACSINITRLGHFLAIDEAVESLGVKRVKQNIGKHLGTEEDLKERMAAVEFERERMNLLLSDFIDDPSVVHTERNLKSRKESTWKLTVDLLEAFNMSNPASHPLFQNTSQNNNEGFHRLFACYNIGKERLYNIYKQDIEKTVERNTTGRRARNIVVDTIAQQK